MSGEPTDLAGELRAEFAWPDPHAKARDGRPAATSTRVLNHVADWLIDDETVAEATGRLWHVRAGFAQRAWAKALLTTVAELLREQDVTVRVNGGRR